jgi:hypothetical protein
VLYEVCDFSGYPSGADMLLEELEGTVALFVFYIKIGFAFND